MSATVNNLATNNPIGIFDSGIGGLTITKAIVDLLPNENIIYFGDTARHPYGEKSAIAIQEYSVQITNFLLTQKCKMIVIACHTASALAYEILSSHVRQQAIVINVIDPLVTWLVKNYSGKKLGLIGTKQTIASQVYQQKITSAHVGITVKARATNLLAAAIEEFGNHTMISSLLKVYLNDPGLKNIQGLILACTHYPIIKDKLVQFYKNRVDIIDASQIIATEVQHQLTEHKLINTATMSKKRFYVSDDHTTFLNNIKVFCADDIVLKKLILPQAINVVQ